MQFSSHLSTCKCALFYLSATLHHWKMMALSLMGSQNQDSKSFSTLFQNILRHGQFADTSGSFFFLLHFRSLCQRLFPFGLYLGMSHVVSLKYSKRGYNINAKRYIYCVTSCAQSKLHIFIYVYEAKVSFKECMRVLVRMCLCVYCVHCTVCTVHAIRLGVTSLYHYRAHTIN